MQHLTRRRGLMSAVAACATALCGAVVIFGQDDPLVKTEPLAQVIQRTQQEKPTFAKRQQDLLNLRYDLANRPATGVTMSRGKAVQEGVRVKLAAGTTWERLAAMTPDEIKAQDAWPAGFYPLPHPHHEAGGMIFPKPLIEEVKKQTERDLTRFDLDFDLPDHLIPEIPPGSVYSEPGGGNHFARTGAEPVLVQITGIGPTDTRYVNPSDAPKTPGR